MSFPKQALKTATKSLSKNAAKLRTDVRRSNNKTSHDQKTSFLRFEKNEATHGLTVNVK